MTTKRAQGLAINQLIAVALGLIVLVAMAFFLFGTIDSEDATPCVSKFGTCSATCSPENTLEASCSEGLVCCKGIAKPDNP